MRSLSNTLIFSTQVLHWGPANPTATTEQRPAKPPQADLLWLPCCLYAGLGNWFGSSCFQCCQTTVLASILTLIHPICSNLSLSIPNYGWLTSFSLIRELLGIKWWFWLRTQFKNVLIIIVDCLQLCITIFKIFNAKFFSVLILGN